MKNLTSKIFVGLVALVVGGAAHAEIASKAYVDARDTATVSTINTTLQDYSTTTEITNTVNQIVADSINDAVEGIQGDLTDMATQTWVGEQGFADAALVDAALAGKADTTDLDAYATTTAVNAALATKANTADLGTLAAKNIAAKADLAADVQTSLGLADTALQSADLNGYATTTSVNTALAAKADTADLGALATKDVAAKTDLAAGVQTSLGLADTALQSADLTGYATTTEVTTGLATKADKATTYTKTEVDTAVGAKADTATVNTALAAKADTTAVNTALAAKANTADLGALAAKSTVAREDMDDDVLISLDLADTALQSADLNGYATTTTVNAGLATKADKATTYTKTEVDEALNEKAERATTLEGYGIGDAVSVSDAEAALATKADKATTLSGYGITDAMTTAQVNTALGAKANTADLGVLATAAPGACSNPANKCVLTFDGTAYGWEVIER